jgi:hypothetical protein
MRHFSFHVIFDVFIIIDSYHIFIFVALLVQYTEAGTIRIKSSTGQSVLYREIIVQCSNSENMHPEANLHTIPSRLIKIYKPLSIIHIHVHNLSFSSYVECT